MGIVKHNKKAGKAAPSVSTVEIHGLSHEAQGVSRTGQKVMFVEGALPGETVKVRLQKQQRHFDTATTLEILQASDERVKPECQYYAKCGACQLQHLASDKQLPYKQGMLHEQLIRQAKISQIPWQPAITSDAFAYRRRARLGIRYRKQLDLIIIGFREQANSHLQAIESCPVLETPLSDLIKPLQQVISTLQGKALFTQVEFVKGDEHIALVLRVLKPLQPSDTQALSQWAQQQAVQLWLQGDEQQGLECVYSQGDTPLSYMVLHTQLQFNVKDFIQGNAQVNQSMVATALEWLAPQENETVLDLFSGMGNFSLPLATKVKHVTAVEGQASMVQQLLHNAQLNQLNNVAGKTLNLASEHAAEKLPETDIILLDPPRVGAVALMPWLAKQRARILYVACDPSSLVRDAKSLTSNGYRLDKITVMDMFPQSKHVESMALFIKD